MGCADASPRPPRAPATPAPARVPARLVARHRPRVSSAGRSASCRPPRPRPSAPVPRPATRPTRAREWPGGRRTGSALPRRPAGRREPRTGLSRRAPAQALLAPPLLDPAVVAGEQHVRDAPAAELGWPCVVRILEAAVERGREAL